MTDDEIIERIDAAAEYGDNSVLRYDQHDVRLMAIGEVIDAIRAAGFEVVAADELEQLRHADEEPDYYDECQAAEEELVAAEVKLQQLEDELDELRARQIPPGWVCVDPEAELDSTAFCATDDQLRIEHNGIRYYVGGVHEAIRAYLRTLRDQQKEARNV